MNKRGQGTSAGNVATLISLIALFLVVYLLLLPPEDRAKILDDSGFDDGGRSTASGKNVKGVGDILLSEFIGEVEVLDKGSERITHDIASVNLFSREEAGFVTLSENLIITKGIFSGRSQNLFFRLESEDVLKTELFLVVDSGDGDLVVRVNGNEFYRNAISNGQIVLEIPRDFLSNSNNIELAVEGFGPGAYKIRDVKLRKKEEIKNRVARRTFNINAEEKSGMKRAVLRYSVFCERDESESLKMLLNENLVFTDVPFCNLGEDVVELAPGAFRAGVNTLDFETEGDYVVEGIHIKTFSGTDPLEEYFFTLDREDFVRVRRGLDEIVASFDFSLRDDRKNFVLEINGEEIKVDTTDDTSLVVLSELVEEENLIRIVPENSFEILEFKIVLE
jgi:hypothetical protein